MIRKGDITELHGFLSGWNEFPYKLSTEEVLTIIMPPLHHK